MREKKELTISISNQVKEKMASDPELAAAMREMFAIFHQAFEAVQAGRYKNMEDAIEAITGSRPKPVEPDDPFYDEIDKNADEN